MVVSEGTTVYCSACDFSTTIVMQLREHIKSKHDFKCAKLNQMCKFCYKMFQTRSLRERHEQEVHLPGKTDIVGT